MGELYLDNIDIALMQEYERRRDRRCFKETGKAVKNLQPGQRVPAHRLRRKLSPDKNFAIVHKR
jgi:hypothetical protein